MKLSGGAISTERGANAVLVVFVIIALAASFFMIAGRFSGGSARALPPGAQVEYPPNAPPRLAVPAQ